MFITFAFRKSRPTPPKMKKAKKKKPIATISHSENSEHNSGTDIIESSENGEESTQNEQNINLEHLLENNSLPLPHWVRRIAWFIVFMSVLSSAFFLLLYSMEWGQAKSEEWLSSFLLSFFESLLCVDPLKVPKILIKFLTIISFHEIVVKVIHFIGVFSLLLGSLDFSCIRLHIQENGWRISTTKCRFWKTSNSFEVAI